MSEFEPCPATESEETGPLRHLVDPQKCPPAYGWRWLKEAFVLFRKSPWMWLGFLLTYMVVSMLAAQLPVFSICLYVIGPVFMGGIVRACVVIDREGELEPALLFDGFLRKLWPLTLIGLSYIAALLLGSIALVVPLYFLVGLHSPLLITLIVLLVSSFAISSIWFAPALVVLHGQSAFCAMRNSMIASVKNILPLTVLSILAFLMLLPVMFFVALGFVALTVVAITTDFLSTHLSHAILSLFSGGQAYSLEALLHDPQFILATLTLAAPTLVWMQVVLLTQYSAYRDIFLAAELD